MRSRPKLLIILRLLAHLFLCLAAANARPLVAQDATRILRRLPDEAGIYVWTNDFPGLLQQVESWSWPAIEISEEDHELDSTDRARLDRLQSFRQVWQMLTEDRLFPGEAVVLLGFNHGASSEEPLRAGVRSELTSIAFLARTEADEQQIRAFGSAVRRLSDPTRKNDTEGGATNQDATHDGMPGVWRLSDGWFCWSDTETQADKLMSHITGDVETAESIFDNRSFQTAHRKLGNPLTSTQHVSAFASSTALDWLLSFFEALPVLSEVLSDASKGERFLHEMRGLALRGYLNDREIEANLDGLFALDAFLLVTQPRHGFFAAVGNQASDSIDFDVPLLPLPVQNFTLISFCEGGLSKAMAEISRMEPEEVQDNAELKLFQRFQQVVISNFWPMENDRQLSTSGYRLSEPDKIDFALEFNMEMIPFERTDGYLRELHQQDVKFLASSREEIERRIKGYQTQLEKLPSELDKVRNDASLSIDERDRRIERMERYNLIFQQALNDQIREREHPQPLMVLAKRWLLSWHAEDELEELDLGDVELYQDQHPQLMELQRDVESLTKVLGYQPNVQGVFSIWSNPAPRFDYSKERHDTETPSNEIDRDDGDPSVDDPILAAAQSFYLQQLDKFFLAITNDEDGFRISGALTHVPEKEQPR